MRPASYAIPVDQPSSPDPAASEASALAEAAGKLRPVEAPASTAIAAPASSKPVTKPASSQQQSSASSSSSINQPEPTDFPPKLVGEEYLAPFDIVPPAGSQLKDPVTYKIQSDKDLTTALSGHTTFSLKTGDELLKEDPSRRISKDLWYLHWPGCKTSGCEKPTDAPIRFTVIATDNAGDTYTALFSIEVETQQNVTITVPENFDRDKQSLALPDAYRGVDYIAELHLESNSNQLSCEFADKQQNISGSAVDNKPIATTLSFSENTLNAQPVEGTFAPTRLSDINCYKAAAVVGTYHLTLQSLPERPLTHGTAALTKQAESDDTPPDSGMYRYYFTAGDLLSKQDGSFSHSDLFLDFHADRSLLLPGNYPNMPQLRFRHRPGFNSYFDVRLTSVPAAVQNCTQNTAAATAAAATTADTSACTSATSTSPGKTSSDATQVFLNSQKSASLAGGFYFPFMLPVWSIDNEKYATFFAPIAKVGFQTTIDDLGQTQQDQQSQQPNVAGAGVSSVGNSSTFYKNYSYGGRLGVFHFPAKAGPGHAPEIEHYIDVTFGRFSNLPTSVCADLPSGKPPCSATSPHVYQRQYRFALEGFFQVPATHGFSIGFSANVAQDNVGAHHWDYLPPDDLRFFFGYKFDIQNLVNISKKSFASSSTSSSNGSSK